MKLIPLRLVLLAPLIASFSACGDNGPAGAGDARSDSADTRDSGDGPALVDLRADLRPDVDAPAEVKVEVKPEAAVDGADTGDRRTDTVVDGADRDAEVQTDAVADAINPCAIDGGGCAVDAVCTDKQGVATCSCKTGYEGDGKTCTPINNCQTGNGGCDAHATCTTTGPGTNLCTCQQGYHGDGQTCYPIDNCAANHGTCDAHADCMMIGPGTSTCVCGTGYSGNGKTCAAVNNCLIRNGYCDGQATCAMTGPGTNSCTCKTGFSGDGQSCAPINNCLTANGGCDAHAACTMTGPGTNHCACNAHYDGDGVTCAPVNSCLTANGGCDANAACTMTGPGTNSCACNAHYDGDGVTCTPVNSCLTAHGGCDVHAACAMTGPGTNSCTCTGDYVGDGTTCEISVCTINHGGCATNADCQWLAGNTNACLCNQGYQGNGQSCITTPAPNVVGFLRANSYTHKNAGTVEISVMHTRGGSAFTLPYTLGGAAKMNNSDGDLFVGPDYPWTTLTFAIDPSVQPGDTLVVTLGASTSGDTPSLGIATHTVHIVDNYCTTHYPNLVVVSAADVDGDSIPDGCDVSLAPAGKVSTYLKPVSAAASSEAGQNNLVAANTITDPPGGVPPDQSFIFQHDWSKDYAPAGALLSSSARLTQWFETTFADVVTVNELRLINFTNFRNSEWMRGIKTFNVYGSNTSGAVPAEGGVPRGDMHLLGTLNASSFWERSWPNPTRGLPEVLQLSAPGAYKYYFLEQLESQRSDRTDQYPGDLTGFEKIEFATYSTDPCLVDNGGCDAMATCQSSAFGAVQCHCPTGMHARGTVCVAGAYDPQTVTGLSTWLSADALTAVVDGDSITAWLDRTSNANNAAQLNGSQAPRFVSSALNGMPVLHFDGQAAMSMAAAALPTGNDPYTVIVVAAVSNTNRNGLVCGGVPGGNTANCFRTLDGGEGAYGLVDYWWANDVYTPAGVFTPGQAFIGMTRYTNGDRSILVDGQLEAHDTAHDNNVVPNQVVIGTTVVNEFLDGDIAEILIYSSALSDSDREYVDCYLADKYGITLAHACL